MRQSKSKTDALWQKIIRAGAPGYRRREVVSHPITEEIIGSWVLEERVADFGCGLGARTAYLAEFCRDLVGIDVSLIALEYARENFPQITFVAADLLNLPFAANCFDNGILAATIEHVGDIGRLLEELTRVVKDRIFISVTDRDYHKAKTHCHSFTAESLKQTLQQHFSLDWLRVHDHIIFAQVKT